MKSIDREYAQVAGIFGIQLIVDLLIPIGLPCPRKSLNVRITKQLSIRFVSAESSFMEMPVLYRKGEQEVDILCH